MHRLPIATPARESRVAWFLICFALIGVIVAADHATGYEVSLSVVYLAPVVIAAWMLGLRAGLVMAAAATAAWYVTFAGANPYPHPILHGWDALVRASTASIFALVIDRLRLALARSDERLVTVLEGLDAAVYVADNDTGALLYVNDRCRTTFGANVRMLTDIESRLVPSPATVVCAAAPVAQRELVDRVCGNWHLVNRRSVRWVDGKMVTLHTATDITQHKRMEGLAQDRQAKLEMSSRLVTAGEMASTLAHELNQPIASILNYNAGCVELLQTGTGTTEDVLEGLDKSSEQAERVGAILQRVRDFIARREPQFSPCELGEVMREAARLAAAHANRHGVRVDVEPTPDPIRVEIDAVMLQQLVLNLSKNAVEAMESVRPEERRLLIRWRCDCGQFDLDVSDRLPGIPAELKPNLFIPFFSTKRDGMGLGLHICRSIAEYHDGHLSALENPDGGAIFRLSFPAERA